MNMDMNMDTIMVTTHLEMRALPPWNAIMAAYMEMSAVHASMMVMASSQSMYTKEAGNMNGCFLRFFSEAQQPIQLFPPTLNWTTKVTWKHLNGLDWLTNSN